MNFKLLQQLVDELNSTNSMNDKKDILSKPEYNDQFIKDVFVATYNPFVQYYVTPANLKKNSNLSTINNFDLFELLDELSSRKITGHDAIGTVNVFILNNPGFEEPSAEVDKGGRISCKFDDTKTDWETKITGTCGTCITKQCTARFSVKFNCTENVPPASPQNPRLR